MYIICTFYMYIYTIALGYVQRQLYDYTNAITTELESMYMYVSPYRGTGASCADIPYQEEQQRQACLALYYTEQGKNTDENVKKICKTKNEI